MDNVIQFELVEKANYDLFDINSENINILDVSFNNETNILKFESDKLNLLIYLEKDFLIQIEDVEFFNKPYLKIFGDKLNHYHKLNLEFD